MQDTLFADPDRRVSYSIDVYGTAGESHPFDTGSPLPYNDIVPRVHFHALSTAQFRQRCMNSSPLWKWVLVYAGWFLLFLLSLWLVFLVQRNLVEDIFFMQTNPWRLRFVHQWSIFILGAIWIVFIVLIEGYLRNGVELGRWPQRMVKASATLAALIALSWGIHWFM